MIMVFVFVFESGAKTKVSPFQYGLSEAKTSIERYWALYHAHCAAIEHGTNVSYNGIDSMEIEIPQDAKPIPLGEKTDFNNMVLRVVDNTKDAFIFEMTQKTKLIKIEKSQVDSGNFSNIKELKYGTFLLIIQDNNPWVENRKGYNYGHIRRDILVIKDGKALNKPISPYDNDATSVSTSYCQVKPDKKYIRNLRMFRAKENSKKAFLFDIRYQYDVKIENIEIYTLSNDSLVSDRAIKVYDSANIYFRNIEINGTYSIEKQSGYGLSLNNLYNSKFHNLSATGNWGVFGTNNMNTTILKKCDINRFDIHCYGKNAYFCKCIFRDRGIMISSMLGDVICKGCHFINSVPLVIRSDYNAYTKFDLTMKNCLIYNSNYKNCYVINANGISNNGTNKRSELSTKYLPNVSINGLRITADGDNFNKYYLIYLGKDCHYASGQIQLKDVYLYHKLHMYEYNR